MKIKNVTIRFYNEWSSLFPWNSFWWRGFTFIKALAEFSQYERIYRINLALLGFEVNIAYVKGE